MEVTEMKTKPTKEEILSKYRFKVNLDKYTWAAQFEELIEAGYEPEESIWPDYMSEIADEDWTW